jgi:hypothetical protein
MRAKRSERHGQKAKDSGDSEKQDRHIILLTPGFSQVSSNHCQQPFQRLSLERTYKKPLKRLAALCALVTALKRGVNEIRRKQDRHIISCVTGPPLIPFTNLPTMTRAAHAAF